MDKQFGLNLNDKKLGKYIKLIAFVFLLVVESLVCAQYINLYMQKGGEIQLATLIVSCIALAVLVASDSFFISNTIVKMVTYGVDSALMLAMCVITGNTYLSTLYCLVLTQFYISIDDLKTNFILFAVSCGLFIASFVWGWVVINRGVSLYESIVFILGEVIFGVFIIAVHCVVTNFILKFYSNNMHLRKALQEADESRAQLKEAYEQLSETMVFEERNRIAKDIHDNAGHSITTVIMQTEAAKLLIDSDPREAKARIISANIQAKNALDQMRESVHLLAGRNSASSLAEDIKEIIAQTIDGTELKIRCDLQEVTLEAEKSRFILNSVKECLANGIRHGNATAFYIEMKKSETEVSLLISDNGTGTDGEPKEGFGLKGMREKAVSFGGRCSFSGETGEGFEAEIILPLN